MYCIDRYFPGWRELSIHESSPVRRGASERLRREAPDYVASQYYPNKALGAVINGFRNENLEALTFPDASFDLHISQDVFEHIFNPAFAFREVARTLRPNGAHIFTTPLVREHLPTEFRACRDAQGTVLHLKTPPEYHANPASEDGSLVTVHWGYDITGYIFEVSGLFTETILIDALDFGIRAKYIEVFISRKSTAGPAAQHLATGIDQSGSVCQLQRPSVRPT